MKLMYCAKCGDIRSLDKELRKCKCGSSSGRYINNLDAEVSGADCYVLGFANSSFEHALVQQMALGDSKEKYSSGPYKGLSVGRQFTAFIIPNDATSVKRI